MERRTALHTIASLPVILSCGSEASRGASLSTAPAQDVVKSVAPLGFLWKTLDPFLFCAHHNDAYPAGNGAFGPQASLEGRNIGSDFEAKDGWSMYHGSQVPGFPQHPHRGFETVTIVRQGLVDHADSLGAAARYGGGDVQWLTAGSGIVHAEMFPLLEVGGPNPLELFQIWLNLPAREKMTAPNFSMLWRDVIPKVTLLDEAGKAVEVTVIAGSFEKSIAATPPPKSWAADPSHDVTIYTLKMAPGARLVLPAGKAGCNRMLYFFQGSSLTVGTRNFDSHSAVELIGDAAAALVNGPSETEVLVLSAMPVGEAVAKRGPFVMNTEAEIRKAYEDYQSTRFGGWPWPKHDPVHDSNERFARHADGRIEKAT